MEAYQQRVIDERGELGNKLAKLRLFLDSSAVKELKAMDVVLLEQQERMMAGYMWVLDRRVERFEK